MKTRPAIWLAAGFLALGAFQSLSGLPRNLGSLAFAGLPPSPPAAGHPRSEVWAALEMLKSGDTGGAIARLDGSEGYAEQVRAEAFFRSGDLMAAIAAWESLQNLSALLEIAGTAEAAGDPAAAEAAYYAAWRVDVEEGAGLLAGFLARRRGDPGRAVEVLQQTLAENPRSFVRPFWLRQLGDLLIEAERWEEAIPVYETFLQDYPRDEKAADVYYELAWAYYHTGMPDAAETAIAAALSLEPDNPDFARRQQEIFGPGG